MFKLLIHRSDVRYAQIGGQLLGFSMVPLSEIVTNNGKLDREFSLSSTDLFHSPSGFVQLSLSYGGSSPEVMAVAEPVTPTMKEATDESITCEYDKVEFPDLDCQSDNDAGVEMVESFEFLRDDTPSATSEAIAQPLQKREDTEAAYVKPLAGVDIGSEQPVVQQEIVDMYMRSMRQFTESLANMKLPMDIEYSSGMESGDAVSGKKLQVPKNGSVRVFYGSRAFF